MMQRPKRWQDDGLSVSFRACQLQSAAGLAAALSQAAQPTGGSVSPADVGHLDLAENELQQLDELQPFECLLSLDASHNSVERMVALPPSLMHLNVAYNRLESAATVGGLTCMVELNLGYNLLTDVQPIEALTQLQVLLLAGNRISTLQGLTSLQALEVLDLKFNYIERPHELRLLSLNARLRTLTLQGNPVAKLPSYRASIVAQLPALTTLDGEKTPRSSVRGAHLPLHRMEPLLCQSPRLCC